MCGSNQVAKLAKEKTYITIHPAHWLEQDWHFRDLIYNTEHVACVMEAVRDRPLRKGEFLRMRWPAIKEGQNRWCWKTTWRGSQCGGRPGGLQAGEEAARWWEQASVCHLPDNQLSGGLPAARATRGVTGQRAGDTCEFPPEKTGDTGNAHKPPQPASFQSPPFSTPFTISFPIFLPHLTPTSVSATVKAKLPSQIVSFSTFQHSSKSKFSRKASWFSSFRWQLHHLHLQSAFKCCLQFPTFHFRSKPVLPGAQGGASKYFQVSPSISKYLQVLLSQKIFPHQWTVIVEHNFFNWKRFHGKYIVSMGNAVSLEQNILRRNSLSRQNNSEKCTLSESSDVYLRKYFIAPSWGISNVKNVITNAKEI